MLLQQFLQPANRLLPDSWRRVEEFDGHGVVCDVVLAVFLGQTRVAEQMGPVCREGALELSRGFFTDDVNGVAEVVVGDALDDLDGAIRVVPVNQEVCA